MYEYASDVLRAMKIDPEEAMLIYHAPSNKRFRCAQSAGYIKEFTAMQKAGFAKDKDYLMVFIGGHRREAKFFAVYYIANRFLTRAGHVPADYPNTGEVKEQGDYLELREERLPQDIKGFTIDWGRSRNFKHRATIEKPIIEITLKTE